MPDEGSLKKDVPDRALLLTTWTHLGIVLIVGLGSLLAMMYDKTIPTGFFALAAGSLMSMCPKCMAFALTSKQPDEHDH